MLPLKVRLYITPTATVARIADSTKAAPLGLLEEETHVPSLATMSQGLSRFLFDRINHEYRSIPAISTALEQALFNLPLPPSPDELVSRVLATSAVVTIKCMNCRSETTRPGTAQVNDLMYPPPKASVRGGRTTKTTFSQVLKMGVERETASKGWCSRCQRYQNLQMRKTIHSVPAVLAVNTAVSTPDHRRLWATPGWLPEEIGVIVDQGQFFCFEGEDLKLHIQRGIHSITVYSLIGMVVNIESSSPQKTHLVSMINGKFGLGTRSRASGMESLTTCSCTCRCNGARGEQVAPLQRLLGEACADRRGADVQCRMEDAGRPFVPNESGKQHKQHGLEDEARHLDPV